MPATSQAQRGYLASTFGIKWMQEHHFDNKGKLPYKKGKSKKSKPRTKPMTKRKGMKRRKG